MSDGKKIKAKLLKLLTKKHNVEFNLADAKKVLVLKYDRIGDMIVATPIFRELKKKYPDISISVLASKGNRDVLKYNPYIDNIYTNYKNSLLGDFSSLLNLRKERFDVCIELEHSVIPHAILRLRIINPKKVISIHKDGRYGVKGSELQLYDFYTKKDKKGHFGKIWLDTLNFFKVKPVSNKYDIFLSNEERNKAKEFVSNIGSKIKIGINLEGSFKEKQIQPEELKQICKGIYDNYSDIKIVILTTPNKSEKINKIISKMGFDFVIQSYATDTMLDVAALIEQLDLIITPDTSIVHVASAFDKPIVSIHENNKDSYRLWKPISTLSKTVFAKSSYGLFDYNVDQIIKYSLDFIRKLEDK
jgi:ADP-heptose:LPS heptosyltransferase